ncbi:GAF domain-containing protein [Archangium violaceum]|uniref:ATP-binding protein n=1 Tax=Archangium violaceum TaxID=83451 RepID=UPI00194DEE9B|nr:ATP-binding protein [Archangium violaceum]QRN95994.1 GAF domain-containing protein [Archangium violaceum]
MRPPVSEADLSQCEREPIHLLGGIQPHGVLLAFSEPDLTLRVVSANTGAMLGRPPESLLGQPLAEVLHPSSLVLLTRALSSQSHARGLRIEAAGRHFIGLPHRSDGLTVLELEPAAELTSEEEALAMVELLLSPLTRAQGSLGLLQSAAEAVRALTGFDRVMVYRFDADWHGEVVAESRDEAVDSFQGMHFPASDIPAQARALYTRNTLRLIADSRAAPVPLVPSVLPSLGRPLDLSQAALRSVSPVHLEYLANMAVAASMSVSLVREGRLWGLIACHHRTPLVVPAATRRACDVLARLVALQLASEERAAASAELARRADLQSQLVGRLSAEAGTLRTALPRQGDLLLGLTGAGGMALLLGEAPLLVGATPSLPEVDALARWLAGQHFEGAFHTDRLSRLHEPAAGYADVASGLLAVRLDEDAPRFVLWFRPEVVRTVTWAGNPQKPVVPGPGASRLHPRASFDAWRETVRGVSVPWAPADLAAATSFRGALVGVLLRQAAALARSNAELDAFSGTVAHDLKEPLRGIQQYVGFLTEDYGDVLGEEGLKQLEEVRWLAGRTQGQLDALFEYSRVGRVELAWGEVDMGALVDEVLLTLTARLRENQVEVRTPRPLPRVECDGVRIQQVWANLLINAAKYHRPGEPRWVEVGFVAPAEPLSAPARRRPDEYVFYVRDNGIGIPERFHEAIFEMFRRLHPAHAYGGGSGAGLAIARRLVRLHGGELWVESIADQGSTFFFTLGERPR